MKPTYGQYIHRLAFGVFVAVAGCAGSPTVESDKSIRVYVCGDGNTITIEYRQRSETPVDATIDQTTDAAGTLEIPFIP